MLRVGLSSRLEMLNCSIAERSRSLPPALNRSGSAVVIIVMTDVDSMLIVASSI